MSKEKNKINEEATKRYKKKIVVIGAGPGGYQTAVRLSKAGLDVTLIDEKYAGGTCLNVACIPTKTLLDQISLFEHFKESTTRKKIFSGAVSINLDNLKIQQQEVIIQLTGSLEKLFQKTKINFVKGKARLISDKEILIEDEKGSSKIFADEIIIATGSSPRTIPTFEPDGNLIVSSDEIWNIPRVPERFLVVGSGPIGIEFARVFNALGSKVTIAEIKEFICPILDLEISENLVRSLKRRGINLKPNTASKFLSKTGDKVKAEFISTVDEKRETQEFDQVLIAVGRKPNTENLGLEDVRIELEPQGFVKVDKQMQTNKKNIWAIGDITNFPQLAHTASSQAKVVAGNILGEKKEFNGSLIPSCIFGYPEIAFVGETEEALKEKKVDYKAGKFLFLASGKAKATGLTEGLVKILMDEKTKKILGAHIVGAEASNLIHELVVAMQNNLTVDKVLESIHAHPTYSEVVYEALEDSLGEAVHV